jgi:hypothetical protein
MNRRHALVTILAGASAPSVYTISGTVYDADGSTAVEGATVALGALSAVSAANGTYTITDVPAGASGSMTCTKAGYSWTAITVAAMSGNLTAQNYSNAWWATGGISASCVAAYKPLGAASLATSYVNLANPGTNNATPGTAPTFAAATGWTFSAASSQYLKTGIQPADNWSAFVRYSNTTDGVNNQFLLGSRNGSTATRFFLAVNSAASNAVSYGLGDTVNGAPELLTGCIGFAGHQGYRNGVADGAVIGAWSGTGQTNIFIGGYTTDGANPSAGLFYSGTILAVVFYNSTITAQAAALSAAMAALTNP